MNVRLKTNLILDGRFIERDTEIDDALIPSHLRNSVHVDYDLSNASGKVMILREANFNVTRMDDGVRVSLPVMRAAGETIAREEIPDGWQEGTDFLTSWTPEERRSVQAKDHAAYLEQFQPEPFDPTVPAWRNR